jgi:hypothetical protein
MPTVLLGNEAVVTPTKKDPDLDASPENTVLVPRKELGKQITSCSIPDTHAVLDPAGPTVIMWPLDEQLKVVRHFVEQNFGDKPTWVEADDALLQAMVAQTYGCREGRPKNWKLG